MGSALESPDSEPNHYSDAREFPSLNAHFYPELEQPNSPWKFQDYQRYQYDDFSARGIPSSKVNFYPDLQQKNPLHVLYNSENWNTRRPLHLPNHPIGIAEGHKGFWEAKNPIVWNALYPALQLASRLINNGQYPWWEALLLEPKTPSQNLGYLEEHRGRRPLGAEYEKVGRMIHETLKDLATRTRFCLWSGNTMVHSGLPSEEFLESTTNITYASDGKNEYLVTLAYEIVEPLLRHDIGSTDRAVHTLRVACAVVDETVNLVSKDLNVEGAGGIEDKLKLRSFSIPSEFAIDFYTPPFWYYFIRTWGIQPVLSDLTRHKETIETIIENQRRRLSKLFPSPASNENKTLLETLRDEPNVLLFDEIIKYLFSHRSVLALNSMNFWMPAKTLFCYIYREGGFPGLDWDMFLLFLRACKQFGYIFDYSHEGAGVVHRMEKQWPRELLDPLLKPQLNKAKATMVISFLYLGKRVEKFEKVFQDGFLDHDREDFRRLCNKHLAEKPEIQQQLSVTWLDVRTFDELLFCCHESRSGYTYGPEGIIRKLVPTHMQLNDY